MISKCSYKYFPLFFITSILLSGCFGGAIGFPVDSDTSEENTVYQEQVGGLIGKPKNTVFEKLGNPISCEKIDDSEFCVYTVRQPETGTSFLVILYPIPFVVPIVQSEEEKEIQKIIHNNFWINCYLLKFGKDGILKGVEHKKVRTGQFDYPFEYENCYDQFDVPLSIPE